MKILLISAYFYPVTGGAENHMFYIARELVKKGHEVEVFVSDHDREKIIQKKEEIIDGIKIKRFKTLFRISLSGMFFPGLFPAVKKTDADIIHIHGFRHPFTYASYFTNKPCLLTAHWPDYPKGLRPRYLDFLVSLYDKTLAKSCLKRFDKICIVNELERNWLKKFNISNEKIVLTPNGIPSSYLKQANGLKFRKKYNIKKDELIVLCLSRLHKSKGLDLVAKLSHKFPNIKFVFVGIDGGFLQELKKLSANNCIYTGKVDEEEKLQALNAADIFIHPSHFEAFGIVVLEAFAQKTPVITSDSGGLPWVNDMGLIFEDNNLQDLEEKLKLLINNKELREEIAKKGYEKAKNYTWEKIADKFEELYKNLKRKSKNENRI